MLRTPRSFLALAPAAAFALFAGCFGSTSSDPCVDYCDYLCTCHEGEAEYDCNQCRAEYSASSPALQDECETELVALQEQDATNNEGCFDEEGDTAL